MPKIVIIHTVWSSSDLILVERVFGIALHNKLFWNHLWVLWRSIFVRMLPQKAYWVLERSLWYFGSYCIWLRSQLS